MGDSPVTMRAHCWSPVLCVCHIRVAAKAHRARRVQSTVSAHTSRTLHRSHYDLEVASGTRTDPSPPRGSQYPIEGHQLHFEQGRETLPVPGNPKVEANSGRSPFMWHSAPRNSSAELAFLARSSSWPMCQASPSGLPSGIRPVAQEARQ